MGYWVDGIEEEAPCALCMKFADDCTCEECPTCGLYGCLEHAPGAALIEAHKKATLALEIAICAQSQIEFEMRERSRRVAAQQKRSRVRRARASRRLLAESVPERALAARSCRGAVR